MTERERKSMHLLKQILDSYADLPLAQRMALSGTNLSKKVDEIYPLLKLFKNDVQNEIHNAVAESRVNQRFAK